MTMVRFMYWLYLLCASASWIPGTGAQDGGKPPAGPVTCWRARTCSQCISISGQCTWCQWDQFKGDSRCSVRFEPEQCPLEHRISPDTSPVVTVLEDKPFSDALGQTVQLRPQRISVKARVGSQMSVKLAFKQAEDYPMDLYYLMDISCTMNKHKSSVARMGSKLADKIQNTTKDFRIGFGSYVDKETIPFSNYQNRQPMLPTYSFINHMHLSPNTTEFQDQVRSAMISGNLDSPEGTLDALMQVMVCSQEIGWRLRSDKIIVVATDEHFHHAGDGKLGGVLLPNDAKCHLVNGRYVGSTIYDYPSMYQISEVALQNKFNLVFTVRDRVAGEYQLLANVIGPNARVASLQVGDDTIVELIDEVYRNISNQIELNIEQQPEHVEVEIWTRCSGGQQPGPYRRSSACSFFGKATIEFEVKIRVNGCPSAGPDSEIVRIGLLNKDETFEIRLETVCQCRCEIEEAEPNSAHCSHNGTFSCGICTSCNGIRSGARCECDPDRPIDPRRPDAHCRPDANSRPCNGRGQCVCSRCRCEPMFAGRFCEQDHSACFRHGVQCSGHGQCRDQQCQCQEGFVGAFCQCPLANHTCITNSTTGELCSGRGQCHCGQCKCTVPSVVGDLCQHCAQCEHQQHCQFLRSCVPELSGRLCQRYLDIERNRTVDPECDSTLCTRLGWHHRWQTNESARAVEPGLLTWFQAQCSQVMNGCVLAFEYRLLRSEAEQGAVWPGGPFVLTGNLTEACPIRIDATKIALGSFVSVLLAGLVCILVSKCVTHYLDHREYERFRKEISQADFALMQNPLYKEVTTQFRNPVFGGLRDRTSKFFFNKK